MSRQRCVILFAQALGCCGCLGGTWVLSNDEIATTPEVCPFIGDTADGLALLQIAARVKRHTDVLDSNVTTAVETEKQLRPDGAQRASTNEAKLYHTWTSDAGSSSLLVKAPNTFAALEMMGASSMHATMHAALSYLGTTFQEAAAGQTVATMEVAGLMTGVFMLPFILIGLIAAVSAMQYETKEMPRTPTAWLPLRQGAPDPYLVAACPRYLQALWGTTLTVPLGNIREFITLPITFSGPHEDTKRDWRSNATYTTEITGGKSQFTITAGANHVQGGRILKILDGGANGTCIISVDHALTIRDHEGVLFGQLEKNEGDSNWAYTLHVYQRRTPTFPLFNKNMELGWPMMALGKTSDSQQYVAISVPNKGRLLAKAKRAAAGGAAQMTRAKEPQQEQLVFETEPGVDTILCIACFMGIFAFESPVPGSLAAALDVPLGALPPMSTRAMDLCGMNKAPRGYEPSRNERTSYSTAGAAGATQTAGSFQTR